MKNIDGFTVYTYEEWKEQNGVAQMLDALEDCDTCLGTGEHECECGHTHECGSCSGIGKDKNPRNIYETQLRDEISRLKAYVKRMQTA